MDADRVAVRIFDLIDARQTSQAEGALETALQKFPEDDSIRAAEALLLLRNGNYALAKSKAIALSQCNVTKPKAVNALVHVLQNCCCWEALAATYERIKPLQNERQISENLVQTYVRMGAYAKAQQTATQLYRQYSDPKYQVWMVQAMLAQVPADSTDHMLLKLAKKLLDAAVLTEKGHVVPSTVQTYVDVLAQQGQYAVAADFLLSERAAKLGLLATRLEALARMLHKAGRTAAANCVARQLWCLECDNWTSYTLYKDTLAPAEPASASEAVLEVRGPLPALCATVDCGAAHHTLEEAVQQARELQAQEEVRHPNKLRRGPYLAELDLLHTLQSSEMEGRVMAYVERFYRKPCCYLDISTFLTPSIAHSVHEWSRAPAAAAGANDALDGHTRRLLGLRCLVGAWEATPPAAELRSLFAECVAAYESAKPLSEGLAWSEEGLCDGYITVALNIALRGFAASDAAARDYGFLVAGLNVMGDVDRRLNNPTWLIYAVCFANRLGLTECTALHQLAFKNVQRDTMAHVGFWPMLSGLALEDVAAWNDWADDHYNLQERDCSLLRAKVFNYTSWPAMQDVQRFEASQANSLYRWQCPANEFASTLLECQTQKDVHEAFETRVERLYEAWRRLSQYNAVSTLVDNTDWVVAKSMVLGNIHSTTVRQLTEVLVSVPSVEWQVARTRETLASVFLLHDLAAVHAYRAAQASAAQAAKSRKGKGNRAPADAAVTVPTLYTMRIQAADAAGVPCLPALQPIAAVLRSYVVGLGETAVCGNIDGATARLQTYVQGLVADTQRSAAAFEAFLYPQAYILAAVLKMVPADRLPVKVWAKEVHDALAAALSRYEARSWSTLGTTVGSPPASVSAALPANSLAAKLEAEKVHRIVGYVSSLKVEFGVHAR